LKVFIWLCKYIFNYYRKKNSFLFCFTFFFTKYYLQKKKEGDKERITAGLPFFAIVFALVFLIESSQFYLISFFNLLPWLGVSVVVLYYIWRTRLMKTHEGTS
ncbi:uncharacterized protein BX663DRAFT_138215, partial [Cokeromyces recurvatus]|uniref:uncharacterized protein n=1 Tax=Cokeromyces recurvatus TaxID=90255 RepID=UPI002220991F